MALSRAEEREQAREALAGEPVECNGDGIVHGDCMKDWRIAGPHTWCPDCPGCDFCEGEGER